MKFMKNHNIKISKPTIAIIGCIIGAILIGIGIDTKHMYGHYSCTYILPGAAMTILSLLAMLPDFVDELSH